MKPEQPVRPATHLFAVRIWLEPLSEDQAEWRGKVEHVLTLFFNEDLKTPLRFGELNHLGLTYETYKLALTTSLLKSVLGDKFDGDVENALNTPNALGYWPGRN